MKIRMRKNMYSYTYIFGNYILVGFSLHEYSMNHLISFVEMLEYDFLTYYEGFNYDYQKQFGYLLFKK